MITLFKFDQTHFKIIIKKNYFKIIIVTITIFLNIFKLF